jgi:hypothetical protein
MYRGLGHPMSQLHKRQSDRTRRIAEQSKPCVLSRDGYAYAQHSHERENARRVRQMERGVRPSA